MTTITVADFVAKWQNTTTTERASAQEHFIDLCRVLGAPTPHDADPNGDFFAAGLWITGLARVKSDSRM